MDVDPRSPQIATPPTNPATIDPSELTKYPIWAYSAYDEEYQGLWRAATADRTLDEEMADEMGDYWERQQFGRWDPQ